MLDGIDRRVFASKQEAVREVKRAVAAELSRRIRTARSGAEIRSALKEFAAELDRRLLTVRIQAPGKPEAHLEFDGAELRWVEAGAVVEA